MNTRVKAIIYGVVIGALFVASAMWSLSQMLGGDELQLIASSGACLFMFIVIAIIVVIAIGAIVDDDIFVTSGIAIIITIIIIALGVGSVGSAVIGAIASAVVVGIGKRLGIKKDSDWAAAALSMCFVVALSAIVVTIVAINLRGSAEASGGGNVFGGGSTSGGGSFLFLFAAVFCLVLTVIVALNFDRKE